jgi:four helix bundle protein
MAKSVLRDKSYLFAIRIVKLSRIMQTEMKEYVLSKQVMRSGTAIGALIREAEFGQSKPDFINKLSIALKEANETEYWLLLLKDTNFMDEKSYKSIADDCSELIKMLVSSINTAKKKLNTKNKGSVKNFV